MTVEGAIPTVGCGEAMNTRRPNAYELDGDVARVFTTGYAGDITGVFLVDAVDLSHVLQIRWHRGSQGYAAAVVTRPDRTRTTVRLHSLICPAPPGFVTDHANGDRSDNRRANLRVATRALNNLNRRSWRPEFAELCIYRADAGRFRVRVGRQELGRYDTLEEARRVRDHARGMVLDVALSESEELLACVLTRGSLSERIIKAGR